MGSKIDEDECFEVQWIDFSRNIQYTIHQVLNEAPRSQNGVSSSHRELTIPDRTVELSDRVMSIFKTRFEHAICQLISDPVAL